jgi:hypothetical protein
MIQKTSMQRSLRDGRVWVLLLLAGMVLLTLFAAPFRYQELSQPCTGARCLNDNMLLQPETVTVVTELGFTLRQYAIFMLGISFIQLLVSWSLAALLLKRGDLDRMAILVAVYLSLGGFSNPVLNALPPALTWTAIPVASIIYAGYLSFILVFYRFPDGRFVPAWTRWLALLLAANELMYTVLTTYTQVTGQRLSSAAYEFVEGTIWLGSFLAIIATQIYRYFRVSGPVQQVQTRWVVFGSSLALLVGVALAITGEIGRGSLGSEYRLFTTVVWSWLPLTILVSLGIAMLRYRLWDIDVLIRRTLLYGVLSLLLAVVYLGSVTVLQGIFTSLGGSQSELATVISTLGIAALFNPLRGRIQEFIDRRFYRTKYDAEQALAAFAASARSETDLGQLSARLTDTVQETMQPNQIKLWLKTQGRTK